MALLGPALGVSTAQAQAWPERPVRVVIPCASGGGADPVVRPVLEPLQRRLNKPFVADNRGGAGTALGTAAVAAAPADGYTLLYNTSALVTSAAIQAQQFDPVRDFDPVAMLMQAPLAIIVAANSPIRSVADMIRIAREHPERTFYASAGIGSASHFAAEQFNVRAGTRIVNAWARSPKAGRHDRRRSSMTPICPIGADAGHESAVRAIERAHDQAVLLSPEQLGQEVDKNPDLS